MSDSVTKYAFGALIAIALVAVIVLLIVIITRDNDIHQNFPKPSNVFAFGDSTNDPGNLWYLDPQKVTDAKDQEIEVPDGSGGFITVVSKQRYSGLHTNCDGPQSNKFVSDKFDMNHKIGFEYKLKKDNNLFVDYSISGAEQGGEGYLEAKETGTGISFEYQIDEFKTKFDASGRTLKADDVFILRTVGGNEFPEIAIAAVGGADPSALITVFVDKLLENVTKLYALGARNIVVEVADNGAELLTTRKITVANPTVGADVATISQAIGDAAHDTLVAQQSTLWPLMNLVVKKQSEFDTWLSDYAGVVGIIDDDVSISDQMDSGDAVNHTHRFWDDIHLSSKAHSFWANFLYRYVLECIGNVPN